MSPMQPTVSVIIPAFNRNRTLPRTLASVINQTFPDLEIIIIDDASTQPVKDLVASFDDSRIRVLVHETNRGANAARNTGIRSARGKYVAFLDSDDEWDKRKLEIQVTALEEARESVGAHYTGITAFSEDGTKNFQTSPVAAGDLLGSLLRRNEIGTLSSFMARRSVLEEVGNFDEDLPSVQDWDLYIRIARSYEFAAATGSLVNYYLGKDSITRDFNAKAVGLRMLLEKHGNEMSAVPRAFAGQILKSGHYYCCAGSLLEGRRMFLRAIRIHPFAVNAYLFLSLSLLGGRAYEGALRFRQKIRHGIRRERV